MKPRLKHSTASTAALEFPWTRPVDTDSVYRAEDTQEHETLILYKSAI